MGRLKVAVTVVVLVTVTVQEVPEQPPPLQPVKREPELGEAERVMGVLMRGRRYRQCHR